MRSLVEQTDSSIILAEWARGSQSPYHIAAANIRVVGAMVAKLITRIQVSGSHRVCLVK